MTLTKDTIKVSGDWLVRVRDRDDSLDDTLHPEGTWTSRMVEMVGVGWRFLGSHKFHCFHNMEATTYGLSGDWHFAFSNAGLDKPNPSKGGELVGRWVIKSGKFRLFHGTGTIWGQAIPAYKNLPFDVNTSNVSTYALASTPQRYVGNLPAGDSVQGAYGLLEIKQQIARNLSQEDFATTAEWEQKVNAIFEETLRAARAGRKK